MKVDIPKCDPMEIAAQVLARIKWEVSAFVDAHGQLPDAIQVRPELVGLTRSAVEVMGLSKFIAVEETADQLLPDKSGSL